MEELSHEELLEAFHCLAETHRHLQEEVERLRQSVDWVKYLGG